MKTYQYSPLDLDQSSIRLMELLPAPYDDSPICCRISHASLDGNIYEPYDALSYAWGDSSISKNIHVVNFGLTFNKLPVTTNLHSALKALRNTHRFRKHLWIDAICIDQDNFRERGHQVQRMLEIYNCADVVRIWLGPEENECDKSLKELVQSEFNCKKNDQFFELLTSYLSRPWFKRLWVVQEVVAAKTLVLMCGGDVIDVRRFTNLIVTAMDGRLSSRVPPLAIPMISLMRRRSRLRREICSNGDRSNFRRSHGLIELVNTFFPRETSDQRDKVYALVGISKDAYNAEGLYPNYNLSQQKILDDLICFSLGSAVKIIQSETEDTINLEGIGFELGEILYPCNSFEMDPWIFRWTNGGMRHHEMIKWLVDLLSPQNILVGDCVWLFQGTSIPVIIRSRHPTWPLRYSIVQFLTGHIRSERGDFQWLDFVERLNNNPHIPKHQILLRWEPGSAPPQSEWTVIPRESF